MSYCLGENNEKLASQRHTLIGLQNNLNRTQMPVNITDIFIRHKNTNIVDYAYSRDVHR